VPEPVAGQPALPAAVAGFYGKIPARGDFVRSGLPRDFVEPWDDWLRGGLAASRAALGEEWLPAWLEAPVWCFALAPGVCGAGAVIGLWLPSVDRVGRHFPLTLAAVGAGADPAALIRAGGGFLSAAEQAGRAALAEELPPATLAARVAAALAASSEEASVDPSLCPRAGALWWTAGAPRVPPGAFASPALPQAAAFAAMLDARFADGSQEDSPCSDIYSKA
jgi:type VI secretion system protein ImpM